MIKVDIFSGFLGAGKTTLIKKLIAESYGNEKVVLIENEFGEVGIDGGFLKEAGIEITEMNSGCICCSLVGDFGEALKKVIAEYSPERIIIEPSGVGKLSDVIKAVGRVADADLKLNGLTAVVDAKKCKMYMKNFGEFFNNQIESASSIVLSHTGGMSDEKIAETVEMIRKHNKEAAIVTTDWDKLTGAQILAAIEKENTLKEEMDELMHEHEHHHYHEHDECDHEHHHHDHDECEHEHHHHDHDECEHEHHHHDHDECEHEHHHNDHDECDHEHHHHHDGECGCHHHHDHDADEVFASWGIETAHKFTKDKIEKILNIFANGTEYGMILRAKGIVEDENGEWIHFDYVPGEPDIRNGAAEVTGRLCVIGSDIDKEKIEKLFLD